VKKIFIPLVILLLGSLLMIGCNSPSPTSPATIAPAPAKTSAAPAPSSAAPPAVTTSAPSTPAPAGPVAAKPGTPKYGGTLKILAVGSAVNLGVPWQPRAISDVLMRLPCVETLMRVDDLGLPAPSLFASWQIAPDLKSITFKIRPGVKFHDGTDLNADAVKYNLDLEKKTGIVASMVSVTSVDVVDPLTVRFNLSQFDASILNGLTGASIASPTSIQKLGETASVFNPVGTGPFKFASFQNSVSLKYTKNNDYYMQGKPYLDGIEFLYVADANTALMAYKGGQAQYLFSATPKDASELQKAGATVDGSLSSAMGVAFDSVNSNSPFANIKVRQAVCYAIDNAAIAKNLGYGFMQPATQQFAPGTAAFNPNVKGYPYNPQKAKDLLKEAGYPNGFQTAFIVSAVTNKDWGGAIQGYLKDVGINCEIQAVQPAAYTNFIRQGWKNSLLSFTPPNSLAMDPGVSMRSFLSIDGGQYVSIAYPQEYLAKLNQANAEPDNQKRAAILQELAKIIVDDNCMVGYHYIGAIVGARTPEVQGAKLLNPHFQQWNPYDAWLDK
jgi:peptide/nickel transport system substrate-binding protein